MGHNWVISGVSELLRSTTLVLLVLLSLGLCFYMGLLLGPIWVYIGVCRSCVTSVNYGSILGL